MAISVQIRSPKPSAAASAQRPARQSCAPEHLGGTSLLRAWHCGGLPKPSDQHDSKISCTSCGQPGRASRAGLRGSAEQVELAAGSGRARLPEVHARGQGQPDPVSAQGQAAHGSGRAPSCPVRSPARRPQQIPEPDLVPGPGAVRTGCQATSASRPRVPGPPWTCCSAARKRGLGVNRTLVLAAEDSAPAGLGGAAGGGYRGPHGLGTGLAPGPLCTRQWGGRPALDMGLAPGPSCTRPGRGDTAETYGVSRPRPCAAPAPCRWTDAPLRCGVSYRVDVETRAGHTVPRRRRPAHGRTRGHSPHQARATSCPHVETAPRRLLRARPQPTRGRAQGPPPGTSSGLPARPVPPSALPVSPRRRPPCRVPNRRAAPSRDAPWSA